jgi:glycosyltransferase involved in cell wall biosynthesis
LISIITPSYNQGHFIGLTLASVSGQGITDVEHIVIDGGSTDHTLQVLRDHGSGVKWTSGRDSGLADAVNKGVAQASGDLIGWINSDDLYLPGALQAVESFFAGNPGIEWAFGRCIIIDSKGDERWRWITKYKNLGLKRYAYRRLLRENFISQPAVFFRKELFDRAGGLDISLKYAMDYDLWLRFGRISAPGFIDRELSAFRRHGSSKSETGTRDQFREQYAVSLRYQPHRSDRLIHRFNIFKIVWSYRLISLFSRF